MKPIRPPACLLLLLVLYLSPCAKGPNPWSPQTYPDELGRYERDPADLPAGWNKYYVEGQEEKSFWFENQEFQAEITVSFTCGKYMDIPLELLAEHVRVRLGPGQVVESQGYVPGGRGDVYHVRARGELEYDQAKKGQKSGPRTPVIMDYYTVGENHCVVDVAYLAPPQKFERGLADFRACLRDYGIPVAESSRQ